jgi:hypothetical protein
MGLEALQLNGYSLKIAYAFILFFILRSDVSLLHVVGLEHTL